MGELEALEAYMRQPGATETGAAIHMIAAAIRYRLGEDVSADDLRKMPVDNPESIRVAIERLSASIQAAKGPDKDKPKNA